MKKQQPSLLSSEAVSSSSSSSSKQSQPSVQVMASTSSSLSTAMAMTQLEKVVLSIPAVEDPAVPRDVTGGQESVMVERRGEFAAVCKWSIFNFAKVKARTLWSKYFEVGGYDCRLVVYPKGDSQALPGYISIVLQIMDPRGTSSSKWDYFASYCLSVVNPLDESKWIHHDSWHRFSSKKKSHGWCDFTPSATIVDPKSGFLFNNDSILIIAVVVFNDRSDL